MASIYSTARIIAKVRTLADDTVQPYFVDDAQLLVFLDDRQRELARDTLCLLRARFAPVAVKAGDPWVAPPPSVVKPRTAVSQADGTELRAVPVNEIAELMLTNASGGTSGWRAATGVPQYIVTDLDSEWWRLVPSPVAADVLDLEAYVYPDPIESTTCEPQVPDEYAEGLYLGVLADVFNIEDAESMYDPKKALEYLTKWEVFKRDAANKHERDKRQGGRRVRYGGL